MDQKKVGTFIAQCRKEKKLTQLQLAELLEITNQAVSKWENGKGMPDVSLLQPLCDILGITLNELISGERIPTEAYKERAEKNMSMLFRDKQISNLKPVKYLFQIIAGVTLFVAVLEILIGLVGNIFNSQMLEVMLINSSVWLGLFAISFAKFMYDKNKLKQLKRTGICMDCSIEEMIPLAWVRVGNYNSCRVLYSFTYDNQEYRAKSNCYILSPFKRQEDYYVRVYFDKGNPSRSSVEMFQ